MADPTMMKINKLYVDRIVVYVRVSFRPFAKCNCCELHMRHGTRPHGHMHTWYRCFTTEIITVKKIHLTCIIIRLNACGIWFNGCSIREACAHTHVCNIHADGVRNMWFTAECFGNLWSLFVLPIFSHGRKWAADCYSELKWMEKLKNKTTELCSNHATNGMGRWNGKKNGCSSGAVYNSSSCSMNIDTLLWLPKLKMSKKAHVFSCVRPPPTQSFI